MVRIAGFISVIGALTLLSTEPVSSQGYSTSVLRNRRSQPQPCTFTRCRSGARRVYRRYWRTPGTRSGYECQICLPSIIVTRLRACPFVKCGPISSDCPKTIPAPILTDRRRPCLGCQTCVQMCPNTACLVGPPPDCPRVVQGPLTVQNGRPCTECPVCIRRCTDIGCDSRSCPFSIPGDLIRRPGKPVCESCPICNRPCSRSCPQLPSNCRTIPGALIRSPVGEPLCRGCPTCAESCPSPPLRCPLVFCQNPLPGDLIERPGLPPCVGCNKCPPECPQPSCPIRLSCTNPEQTTTTVNGLTCTGCPRCPCLALPCPRPPCQDLLVPTTVIQNGRECPGCPRCPANPCVFPPCAPSCIATPCKRTTCQNHRPTTIIQNGRQCPGCPACPECLPLPCPPLPACPNPKPTISVQNGRDCPGCSTCPPQISCPLLRCESLSCSDQSPTIIYTSQGRKCTGCPRCSSTPPAANECPPFPRCAPLTCRIAISRTRIVNGITCPDCPLCP